MMQEMSKEEKFWEEFILMEDSFKAREKKLNELNDTDGLLKLKTKHEEDFKKLTIKYNSK